MPAERIAALSEAKSVKDSMIVEVAKYIEKLQLLCYQLSQENERLLREGAQPKKGRKSART